jgi:Flp pilus assembly protein TadG
MISKLRKTAISRIQQFKANCAGVAAVEFAFLAPVLILMTLGVAEASHAIIAHKHFQKAVAMMGDLVSREETIGTTAAEADAAMVGMMNAALQAMNPYPTTTLQMGITAIKADPNNGTQTVAWKYSHNGYPVTACGSAKAMPAAGMITNGNSAILVEAQYTYTPLISQLVPGFKLPMVFNDKIANAPRGQCPHFGANAAPCTC